MKELKPCPFCGAVPEMVDPTAFVVSHGQGCFFRVYPTGKRGTHGFSGWQKPEVAEAWNTRAAVVDVERAMSMLTKLVDGLRGRAKAFRQGNLLFGADDAAMMEEAADTIVRLRGRLAESGKSGLHADAVRLVVDIDYSQFDSFKGEIGRLCELLDEASDIIEGLSGRDVTVPVRLAER